MELILKYFPGLTKNQIDKLEKLETLYQDWNLKINVVSRKDIDVKEADEFLYYLLSIHDFPLFMTSRTGFAPLILLI